MTPPAPHPAPLRPGQRAAKPNHAKAKAPQTVGTLDVLIAEEERRLSDLTLIDCISDNLRRIADWAGKLTPEEIEQLQTVCDSTSKVIAGRAALRAGNREGGRGRR